MSFFEPIPEREPERDYPEYRQPAWSGAPDNEVPVTVPLDVTVVRTDDLAVFVSEARVVSTGAMLGLSMRRRGRKREPRSGWFFLDASGDERDARFGVAFADGRRTTLDAALASESPEIVLAGGGGGGGGRRWDLRLWLWPIPPEGPLTFAFRWLAEGIEETLVEVDSGPLREASARAEVLWPDDRPEPPKRDPGAPGWTVYAS